MGPIDFLQLGMSYLIGSIPFGLIIVKIFYKADIRQFGSGNPGATNVWRNFGKGPGMATLALDILKGAGPVMIARWYAPWNTYTVLFSGLFAIIGHNWSIFLKGAGGKGVATSIGVFLAMIPLQSVAAIIAFLAFFLTTRHVSVGSMAGAVTLFAATFVVHTPVIIQILVLVAAIMVIVKHIPNMKRLKKGEEPKVSFGK